VVRDVDGVVVTRRVQRRQSSLVEEMADVLEGAGMSFAAIDLDWLWWFSALDLKGADLRRGGGQRSSDPGRGRRDLGAAGMVGVSVAVQDRCGKGRAATSLR
jgi:hypothetical protein